MMVFKQMFTFLRSILKIDHSIRLKRWTESFCNKELDGPCGVLQTSHCCQPDSRHPIFQVSANPRPNPPLLDLNTNRILFKQRRNQTQSQTAWTSTLPSTQFQNQFESQNPNSQRNLKPKTIQTRATLLVRISDFHRRDWDWDFPGFFPRKIKPKSEFRTETNPSPCLSPNPNPHCRPILDSLPELRPHPKLKPDRKSIEPPGRLSTPPIF